MSNVAARTSPAAVMTARCRTTAVRFASRAPAAFCTGLVLMLAAVLMLATMAAPALAADSHLPVARTVIALGTVQATGADGAKRELHRHDAVYEGDTLQTSRGGRAQFNFNDGGRLALRPATDLTVEAYHDAQGTRDEKISMRLIRGGFRTVTGRIGRVNHAAYRMSTPYAVIGIRGTDWGATLEPLDGGEPVLLVGVNDGGVTITNDGGSLDIGANAAFNFAKVANMQLPPQGLTTPPPQLTAPLSSDLPPAPPPPPADASAQGSDVTPAAPPADTSAGETPAGAAAKPDEVVFQSSTRCL